MVILRREGREDRRRGERRAPKLSRRGLIIGSIVVVAIGAVSAMLILFTGSEAQIGPNVGDHFHAKYAVRVCGEKITDFPYSSGGIHTHGVGLYIYIQPMLEKLDPMLLSPDSWQELDRKSQKTPLYYQQVKNTKLDNRAQTVKSDNFYLGLTVLHKTR